VRQVEEYEIRLDDGREFDFDVAATSGVDAGATTHGAGVRGATLPPKPARSDVYRLMSAAGGGDASVGPRPDDEEDSGVLNVASYAAAIASDTAHLTRLSVSPLGFDAAGQPLDDASTKPTAAATLADPTPKPNDYQNARRQKGKPPSPSAAGTDWSPISDLSPIIDVSPSIERVEQDRMSAGGISRGAPATSIRAPAGDRRVLPNAPLPADVAAPGVDSQFVVQRQPGAPEDVYRATDGEQEGVMMRSSLKRCPNFDNISSISSVNDASALSSASAVSPATRPRTSESVAAPTTQSKFIAVEARDGGLRPTSPDARTEAERGRSDAATAESVRAGESQLWPQDSTRRQPADVTASERSLKPGGAPASSDSSAQKQSSHVETDKGAKDSSVVKTSSESRQSEMTGKTSKSKDVDSPASEVMIRY